MKRKDILKKAKGKGKKQFLFKKMPYSFAFYFNPIFA